MVTVGEAAVIVMRWFVLMMGDLKSSLDRWRIFQYLSLIVLRVKKDSPMVSVVWWFVSPCVGRLMKVAVRGYKLQKLAQHLSDIKGFIHRAGTSSGNDQTSLDLLHELTDETEDPVEIMNLLENRIFELKAANNDRSLDQLVEVLGSLAGTARKHQQDPGYDWFAVLLYISTVIGTFVIIRLWIGPPPSYGSPENYKYLPAGLVCTLAIIVHTRHPIRWDQEIPHGLASDILAILTQPSQQEEPRSTQAIVDANHPQPIQQEQSLSSQPIQQEQSLSPEGSTETIVDANHSQPIQHEQSLSPEGILHANQVETAIAAILISMEDNDLQILSISPPQPYLSDSDWGSFSSSNDEIIYCWYAPMHSLEEGDANLIVSEFIQKVEEKTRGLPEMDAVEMVRTVFKHPPKSGGIYRLSDVNENQWIFQAGTKTFANTPAYTSARNFVMMAKITASLSHLIWLELDGQSWQLCHEVKKECFLGIVGQSLQRFVEVAVSFCDARWSGDHNLQMLTMFDAILDVLHNLRDLPLDSIHNVVAYIYCKMMHAIKRVMEGTTDALHGSNESTIHPATVVLLEVWELFCRNRDMVQHLLDSGDHNTDPCSDIFDYWVRQLKRSARKMFPNKGQRFIFILNNLYFVSQKKWNQGVAPNLDSQIRQYIENYLDKYWVPLMRCLDGETHHSSLVNFTVRFDKICLAQKKWKVRAELKNMLREKIVSLIVARYENLLDRLANPRWRWRFPLKGICRASSQKRETALQVEQKIRALFEL